MKERVEAQLLSLQLYIFRAATKPEWQDRQVAQKYLLPTQEQRSDEAGTRLNHVLYPGRPMSRSVMMLQVGPEARSHSLQVQDHWQSRDENREAGRRLSRIFKTNGSEAQKLLRPSLAQENGEAGQTLAAG